MESPETSLRYEVGTHQAGPVPRLFETVLLGVSLGVCHTVAETTLIGWYGARLGLLDILLFAGIYGTLGAFLAGVLFAGVWMKRKLAGRAAKLITPAGTDRLFLICALLGEGAVGTKLVISHASGPWLYFILAPFLASLGGFALLVARQWESRAATPIALLTLTFSAAGATLAAARLDHLALVSMRIISSATVCIPPALGLAALTVLTKRRHARVEATRKPRAIGTTMLAVGIALAACLALWTSVWPTEMRWHVDRPNPMTGTAATGKPDVLLLVLDTVRSQSLDLFGYERRTMPLLQQFAKNDCDYVAEIFANASSTLPSHASMFTGYFSHSHGAHKPFLADQHPPPYAYALDKRLVTLAEWLSRAGYQTAGIPGNPGVLSSFGIRRGFGYYDIQESDAVEIRRTSWIFSFTVADSSLGYFILSYIIPDRITEATVAFDRFAPRYRTAERINELAFEWLADRKRDMPFFLFLNYMDAHDPYVPPLEYRYRFAQRDRRFDWIGFPARDFNKMVHDGTPVPKLDAEYARSLYDAELSYVDVQVNCLLEHLRRIGCYENTLVIIIGDHGEGFMEHGEMRHSSSLYDTQALVPLLIKLPASRKDTPPKFAENMQHVDVFPTILDILDIEPPAGLQGSPGGAARDYALAEIFVHYQNVARYRRELCAVRVDGFKYIRSTTGQEELYDMAADPCETHNLIGTMPEIERRAKAILRRRDDRLAGELVKGNEDKSLIDRLRSLGYVE